MSIKIETLKKFHSWIYFNMNIFHIRINCLLFSYSFYGKSTENKRFIAANSEMAIENHTTTQYNRKYNTWQQWHRTSATINCSTTINAIRGVQCCKWVMHFQYIFSLVKSKRKLDFTEHMLKNRKKSYFRFDVEYFKLAIKVFFVLAFLIVLFQNLRFWTMSGASVN